MRFLDFPVIISEGIAPNELVFLSETQALRVTPDGGVEELSPYQRQRVEESIRDHR